MIADTAPNYVKVAQLLSDADAPRVWKYTQDEMRAWWKDRGELKSIDGLTIALKDQEGKNRVKFSLDVGPLQRFIYWRDDDRVEATVSATRAPEAIAAEVLRRVIKPARPYVEELKNRRAKIVNDQESAHDAAQQIADASRGYMQIEDQPHRDEYDTHFRLAAHRVKWDAMVMQLSSYDNCRVEIDRVHVPVELAKMIARTCADYYDTHTDRTEDREEE